MASEEDNINALATGYEDMDVAPRAAPSITHDQESMAYAKSYLKAVRGVLQFYGEEAKYDEFVNLLVDHRNRKFGFNRLLRRVTELLKWYPVLIWGFNDFLPERFMFTPKKTERLDQMRDSLAYLSKVKERFQNDEERYNSFLGIVIKKKQSFSDGFFEEIQLLFHGNYDLLDEFGIYLPAFNVELA